MAGFRERLSKLNEEAAKAVQAPLPEGDLPKTPSVRKPRKEVGPQVKYRCGHKRPVVSLACRVCPECASNLRIENLKNKKQKSMVEKPWRHGTIRGRLPGGSCFSNMLWNGKTWTGTLMVWVGWENPEAPRNDRVPIYQNFTGEEDAVFRLLPKLDWMYREWLAAKGDSPLQEPAAAV